MVVKPRGTSFNALLLSYLFGGGLSQRQSSVPLAITVDMGFQRSLHPLLGDVGTDVEVLQFWIAAVQVDHQRVLLDNPL